MQTPANPVIPCPNPACPGTVQLEANALLAGVQFGCSHCSDKVGLAARSRPKVADTMSRFNAVKQQLHSAKGQKAN